MIEIVDKKNCAGCNACYSICPVSCIDMLSDEEGFWYPNVDKETCIKCGKCIDVCPEINEFSNKRSIENPRSVAAWNSDLDIRERSSSGGIFDSLARQVLKENGIIFGAGYDSDLQVIHKGIEDIDQVDDLRTSKYVQSDIGRVYIEAKKYLEEDKMVLFVGTPCQISGLYKYLGRDYENLYTVDFICHGVPSPKLYKEYVSKQEEEYKSEVKSINFRNKSRGWNRYSMEVNFKSGEKYLKPFDLDPYLIGFSKNYTLRPSCYDCKYTKLPRVSDITLGDYWGVANKHLELDDDRGISLLLINTKRGEQILESTSESIHIVDTDLNYAISNNPSLVKSVEIPNLRYDFFKDYLEGGISLVRDRYLQGPGIIVRTKNQIRRNLGFIKRKIKKKL